MLVLLRILENYTKSLECIVFLLPSFLLVIMMLCMYRFTRTVLILLKLIQGGNKSVIAVHLLLYRLPFSFYFFLHVILQRWLKL